MLKVTVWNENRHEQKNPVVKEIYPNGNHGTIAAFLKEEGFEVRTATLDEPEHGLTDDVLNNTDVLIWWGHLAHHEVKDEIVQKVQQRVLDGMGLIVLHSGHETYPTYHNKEIQRVIINGVKWAQPVNRKRPVYGNAKLLENIAVKTN